MNQASIKPGAVQTASWEQFEKINLKRGASLLTLSGLQGEALENLYARRDALYNELLRIENIVMPGMAALLSRLKEGFLMGIVTSSHREHFEIIHEGSGLLEHMEFAVVREDYERGKPHPDGYLAGIERTALGAGECIAVEDSPRGAAAARAAGLQCVFFAPGEVGHEREVGDVYARVGSVEELEAALREWAGS